MNFGCTVDTVDTVDTNFGVNCVNCVNCAPSSKRSPFAVAMHYQQRQRQQQQQQQEQREGIKTITTTNTHTQTAITILCPGASPALRSPSMRIDIVVFYVSIYTPRKTNMSPEIQWLEDVFPIEIVPFQGTC